ncbi:signal peptidase II [Mycoplasmoides alvi]|uniref:signal peptidase II n=1 Tax=Mycoplasmoides alvi TaxID=78580 RepID=UPI000695ED15|nr:signal peptidase II [Mycoplasmoides alvi]
MKNLKLNVQKEFKKIKNNFIQSNTQKNCWIKIIILLVIFAIVLAIVFGLRERFLGEINKGIIQNTGFININVIKNTGIGFGAFNDNTTLVYLLQITVFVVILVIWLFNHKISLLIPLTLIMAGSIGNILDRLTSGDHSVLDYFQFWFGGAIFNFADSAIVVGFIILFFTTIYFFIFDLIKESKNEKKLKQNNKIEEKLNNTNQHCLFSKENSLIEK